jgi:hypothetical protein
MPAVEATVIVGWCSLAYRARCGGVVVGEHAARGAGAGAVERKAGGRRGREGGMCEPRQSRSRNGCVIFFICGGRRGPEEADRNDSLLTSGPATGAYGADGLLTPSITVVKIDKRSF